MVMNNFISGERITRLRGAQIVELCSLIMACPGGHVKSPSAISNCCVARLEVLGRNKKQGGLK